MMYSLWKTSACLLMLGLVSTMELTSSANYTLNTTCTKAVYYKNTSSEVDGACFLCFCQDRMETCWPRESSLCGQLGRDLSRSRSRVRRSPIGLSDIFFRDATRDFFDKQIAEQCKPFESSFSDGCPPADWCIGCTVCDCDANGRWDCHILSFCNGEERKKKIKSRKIPLPVMPTRRVYYQNKSIPETKTSKAKKIVKSKSKHHVKKVKLNQSARKQSNNIKASKNTNKPNINARKPDKRGKKPNNVSTTNKKINKKQGPKQPPKKRNPTRKPSRKIYRTKKPQQRRTSIKQKTTTKSLQNKLKRKIVYTTTADPQKQSEVINLINSKNNLEESILGRKIIKRVMTTVHKMLAKQIENLHNSTRVQRSIVDRKKKDCQKNKKNKRNITKLNDVSSVRKNKLKNYRQQYNFRKKREALDLDLSIIDLRNANLIKDNPGVEDLSVKRNTKNYIELVKQDSNTTEASLKENSMTNTDSDNSTIKKSPATDKIGLLNSSTPNIIYYKYTVDKNSSNASLTTEISPTTRDVNETNKVADAMITEKARNITGKNVEKARQYALIKNNPEFNDLKYKTWETVRILHDNVININSVSKFNKTNRRNKDYSIDGSLIKRLSNIIRKNKIKRKLGVHKHSLKRIITNNFKIAPTNYFNNNLTATNTSHNNLQNLLHNLIKELNNKSTPTTKISNNLNIFQYLRNIFKNIFSRKKGNDYKSHKTNEGMTLQILCGNIGACYFNKHNRIALKSKIHDLNAETEKIFKTIKIIKGLLHLLEMPVINKENTTKKLLNNDIQKLNMILRDTYGGNNSMTETQAAQVNYVKENVHQFIGSVGKFASLLNEIIDVLYKNNKTYSCQRNLRLGNKKKKLNSLKNLLIKYNIMQNTFMKKMYQLLRNVEKNMTTENPKPKVSVKDINNAQVIQNYSKHIIENLRRLKNLAQTLNSNRRKRQTMREDDALEYLLVLMEYLLKNKHPLDTAPVNDGIDLLIEAIQNAPNIKSIKKKVFEDFPTTQTATRTTSVDLNYFHEDNISDSNRISKEQSNLSRKENALAMEQVVDNEEDITQIVYYKRFDDDDNTTVYNEYDSTTENIVKNINEKGDTEKVGFDRFESDLDNTRRYEVFNSDLEEESIIPIITTSDTVPTTVTKVDITKIEETTFVPLREYKLDDDSVQNRTKLDWIEENFGKEISEYGEENDSNTTVITDITQTTSIKPPDQGVDNISSLTVEQEEEEKKTKSKIAADDVMHRKQLEFLKSLDYGTEKSEIEDTEMKDDVKYSGDEFPVYFVK